MKKNQLPALLCAAALLLTACDKDYLETTPTSSVSKGDVFLTTDNAKTAVNGLARMMSNQYLQSQGFNGEGTIMMYYGNYGGNHFSMNLPGWSPITNLEYFKNSTASYCYYPWYYYYKLIGNANIILANIDAADGPEAEKQYLKAQALGYRAYAFTMLAQLYCVRWQDSRNGEELGLVLRTDESENEMPRGTMNETYSQIYADLDEAIRLFNESGYRRPVNTTDLSRTTYIMDKDVAFAIYTRAALCRQDYAKASAMADSAMQRYPLMSTTEYKLGFSNPTKEWIWNVYDAEDQTIYFYSYMSYIAYNSTASALRSYPKCISKELFDRIPDTDVRKALFLAPSDSVGLGGTGTGFNATTGVISGAATTKGGRWLAKIIRERGIQSNATAALYMQFKIKNNAQPGVGNVVVFRSSEMLLAKAEAEYFLGNEGTAQTALNQLNKDSGRDPNYDCSATGTDLLAEIKTYRGLELWGEGHDWFDLKRWNDPLARKSFADGGSFISALAVTVAPNETGRNKWVWVIPNRETDYNPLCQQNNYDE